MARTVTDADDGKPVVDSDGEQIGQVSRIQDGTAYVAPEEGLTDTIRSALGWDDGVQDDYALHAGRIDQVTDVEIRLNDNG
ncbi:PRC-barrel domain containing protein [Haloplanus sp.]|uniref:PRC-barrel domain containing protein n=1 Tax=Haloplanus sp. TaxID=1961696 RepID=UPI0026235EE7|nr:PRC-barrel domain containing protein [Haloplanus sp.]